MILLRDTTQHMITKSQNKSLIRSQRASYVGTHLSFMRKNTKIIILIEHKTINSSTRSSQYSIIIILRAQAAKPDRINDICSTQICLVFSRAIQSDITETEVLLACHVVLLHAQRPTFVYLSSLVRLSVSLCPWPFVYSSLDHGPQ